jgi:hypothetical protein
MERNFRARSYALFFNKDWIMASSEKQIGRLKKTYGWLVLAAGLLLLLFYGLSSFFARPTVETITTHAPPAANSQNVKFQQSANH